ncbi:MAG TPA: RNA methyltransferase [Bacteroidota bacterium]|nr:RNA methyltransferase [Bacteroidota bacterium]
MKTSLNVHAVQSLEAAALQPYRTLRRPMDHMREGIFVAEGEKVVRRLLASELSVVSMLMTQEWFDRLFDVESGAVGKRFEVYVAEKKIVEAIVGYNLHQGIMAVGKVPEPKSLETTIASIETPHFLVALDGLVNAENVGVVVRNCAAFGVGAVIAGETSSSPYLRRAVRNSMGTVFQLPIIHSENLRETLQGLHRSHNIDIVAAHVRATSTIDKSDFTKSTCIVLGHEGEGISQNILDICTAQVAIPMMNGTDSLNVASASAAFLYEVRRQRSITRSS